MAKAAKTEKTDRCVVRNTPYTRAKAALIEKHNERQNEEYSNEDIDLSRSVLNVHFKQCEGTYLQAFDKLVADGTISLRGAKKDGSSKIIDEFVFDVNTDYFDRKGGYEYAKSFFEEAYRMAVKEAGGEEYILSAVMHADERNQILSEKAGHDIFHYHLHVTYIPVVDKEVTWTQRCKDPALIGTVKEVIKQVSNSKRWESHKAKGDDGKERLVYSYSLLQDRYFEHMRNAGFIGFERGERGSTTEHLTDTEYKVKQETERLAEATAEVEQKQKTSAALDVTIQKKEQTSAQLDGKTEAKKKQLAELEQKTVVAKQQAATFADIDRMAEKKTIGGNVSLTPADWKTVSGLAKEGIKTKNLITTLREKITALLGEIAGLKNRLAGYEGRSLTDTMQYFTARERAPRRVAEFIADVMRKPPEKAEQDRTAPERKKSQGMEM